MTEPTVESLQPRPRAYETPPVVEALAEVYVAGNRWDLTTAGVFFERLEGEFPEINRSQPVEVTVGGAQTLPVPLERPEERARFRSADGSRAVQIARDVLVFNRLRPYSSFEDWRGDFLRMLALYREITTPTGFTRFGVRYINQIVVPGDTFEMSDYFRLYPEVPEEIGSPFGPFTLRVEARPPLNPTHTMLTTFASSERDGEPSLVLDFYDVFLTTGGNLDEIPAILDAGHANISHAFEHTITDRLRTLFEGGVG